MKDNTLTFDSVSLERQNKAVHETVEQTKPRLLGFIRKRIPDADEAEDILQDVFFQLVQTNRMEPIEQVTAWLYRVARNKITDRFRKKKTDSVEDMLSSTWEGEERMDWMELLASDDDAPETELLREAIMEELELALDELPSEQRAVFVSHELKGISFQEISQETGIGVNTLISRKRYAVLYLRERLHDLYHELITD